MIEAGRAALAFALGANVLLLFLSWRARSGEPRFLASAGRAQEATFLGVLAAALLLEGLLHARDFRLAYVWQYTSSTLPPLYTSAALWAGQAGSILFFTLLLSGYGVVARRSTLVLRRNLAPGFLIAYSEAHFMSEELLMRLQSYDGYEDHVDDHITMLDALGEIAASHAAGNTRLVAGKAAEVLDFIGKHIATRDRSFAEYVRNNL